MNPQWSFLPCRFLLLGVLLPCTLTNCGSIKQMAINKVGDAFSGSGTTFSSDDDPEFVKSAIPFSLKMMESLLEQSPKHEGLLLASTTFFTQYGYAFIQAEADELEERDLTAANEKHERASRMFHRAWNYGIRGLELHHPGFEKALHANAKAALQPMTKKDVPLLYWTAAAGGLQIRADRPQTVAQQPIVEAMIDRALVLDESYDQGAIHSFLIKYEMNRQGVKGDAAERSRSHFKRAVELSHGSDAGPYVSLAEAVCIPKQNSKEFSDLLQKALAIDVDAHPDCRLSNMIMQRRARWLLARKDDLILPEVKASDLTSPTATSAVTEPASLLLPKP